MNKVSPSMPSFRIPNNIKTKIMFIQYLNFQFWFKLLLQFHFVTTCPSLRTMCVQLVCWQDHEIILHRRPCGSKETGEFKQKIWDSPEISFKNKGTINIYIEGYTKLILASAFDFLWGYRKAWKKSEGIGVQDVKDTIHHGATQACLCGWHQVFHNGRTIGKQSFGKMAWSD